MFRIRSGSNSSRVPNTRISLTLLRIFTIISAVIAQLTFISSLIYFLDLHVNYYGENYENSSVCSTDFIANQNINFCQFLSTLNICSGLGIGVGIIQILISVSSISFSVRTQNIWFDSNLWAFFYKIDCYYGWIMTSVYNI